MSVTKDVLKRHAAFGTLVAMQTSADFVSDDNTTSTTHPQYRQIAIIFYGCVLFVGVFDFLSGRPPTSWVDLDSSTRLIIFCTAVLLMCGLEITNQLQRSRIHPLVHLVFVTVLGGVALSVSNTNYSQLLLLIPILFAELTFSRVVVALTCLTTFSFRFIQTYLGSEQPFLTSRDYQSLMIFIVMMIFSWLMARFINRERTNRLHIQSLHNELKETSTQLAQMAVVNERNRMAREIHDSVGHHLAAVSIQLEMASKLHKGEPDTSLAAIHQAQAATQDALRDVRKSVGALRQTDETFSLVPAVELLISRISTDDLAINYKLDGDESICSHSARIVFFRAIQEGLTNVCKHANASHINLWLQFLPSQARLRIIDDGVGFDPKARSEGSGLRGLKDRVESFGGTLSIESRPDEGTFLDIVLPQPTS